MIWENNHVPTVRVQYSGKNRNEVVVICNRETRFLKYRKKITRTCTTDENILVWKPQPSTFHDQLPEQIMMTLKNVYGVSVVCHEYRKQQRLTTSIKQLKVDETKEMVSESLEFAYRVEK